MSMRPTPSWDQKVLAADESGRALPWPILLCLFVSLGYLVYLREFIELNAPAMFGTIVVCCLAIANVFALGCSLQLLFIGTESNSHIRRQLKRQVDELTGVLGTAHQTLTMFDKDLSKNKIRLSARGIDSLAILRRVSQALDNRVGQVQSLLAAGDKISLIDADDLLRRKLIVEDNAVHALIHTNAIEPISSAEWVSTVENLIGEINIEHHRRAA